MRRGGGGRSRVEFTPVDRKKTTTTTTTTTSSSSPTKVMSPTKAAGVENVNKHITDVLFQLASHEKSQGDMHRFFSYLKAARTLSAHPARIKTGSEAQQLPGIGKGISARIDEILETGTLKELESQNKVPENQALLLFGRIWGVGPVAAKRFVAEGYRTLDDLRAHAHKLNHQQQIGLKYFDDFEQKIPRQEVEAIYNIIQREITKVDPTITSVPCGSFRRGVELCGDVDVLVCHPDFTSASPSAGSLLAEIVDALKRCDLLKEELSRGDVKYMGICQLPGQRRDEDGKPHLFRRIDIRLIPQDEYWCGVFHMTGSDDFNRKMRLLAQERGFHLSEYSVCPVGVTGIIGEPVPIESEQDIFDYLDVEYLPPNQRNM